MKSKIIHNNNKQNNNNIINEKNKITNFHEIMNSLHYYKYPYDKFG